MIFGIICVRCALVYTFVMEMDGFGQSELSSADVVELQRFLGLASYYRRFIGHFAEMVVPLYRLLDRDVPFKWSDQCQNAFLALKGKLSSQILALPRTQDTFILDTDASDCGVGAVLSQSQDGQERVTAYGSHTLTKAERNYCTTRKEMLAVAYFIKHFRSYLLGHSFVLRTDHTALKWLSQFKEPEGQVAR